MAKLSASGAIGTGNPADAAYNTQCLSNMIAAGARSIEVDGAFALLPMTLPDVFTFYSESSTSAYLLTTVTNSNFITAGVSFTARGIRLGAVTSMTSGALIYSEKNDTTLEECEFSNYHCALRVVGNTIGDNLRVGAAVRNCKAREPSISSGAGFVDLEGVASATVSGNIVTGPSFGNQPSSGVRIRQCDTVKVIGNNVTKMGRALLIDPSDGKSAIRVASSGNEYDSGQYQSAMIAPTNGGRATNLDFSADWFGLAAGGDDLLINADGGTVGDVTISGGGVRAGNQNGLHAHGPIKGLTITGVNATGPKESAFYFSGGVSNFGMANCAADDMDGRGMSKYGLNIAAGSTGYKAEGRFRGSVASVYNGGSGTVVNF